MCTLILTESKSGFQIWMARLHCSILLVWLGNTHETTFNIVTITDMMY